MFYRVMANLHFIDEDEARDFYHDCELARLKSSIINPGQLNEEIGSISLEKCHHDEETFTQCEPISSAKTYQ